MTINEFIQQTVITTLPIYLAKMKLVPVDFSSVSRSVPYSIEEAHKECIGDAAQLATKLASAGLL